MKLSGLVLALAGAGILVACGGGGGSDSAPNNVPARSTGKISLSGVVAVGQAVANAQVQISCLGADSVNVTATATTDATGNYSVDVPGASLPCVLSVNTTDSNLAPVALSSLAQGAGAGTAVANITPVTTLVVANVADADPAAYIAGFGPATATRITAPAVSTAVTEVTDLLGGAGVTLPAGVNVLTGSLVAANGSTTGNAYDQALDALAQTLTTTGTTLAELTTTVAATSSTTPTATTSNTPSLPAALLLQPKSSTCDALRSTTYRVIDLRPSTTTGDADPVTTTQTVSMNALTLVISNGAVSDLPWTPVAGDRCHYTDSSGGDIVVSPAGVIVGRETSPTGRLTIAVPEQAVALTDLAGSWNAMGWDFGTPSYTINAGTATINSTGQVTQALCFDASFSTPASACVAQTTSLPTFSVNGAGGFDLAGVDRNPPNNPWRSRFFGYRAGGGELMLVSIDPNGSFTFWTRQHTNALPAVNDQTAYWNTALNTNGFINDTAYNKNTNTIKSVSGSTFTRDNLVNIGAVNEHTRTESFQINVPRNGYNHRLAQQVTDTGGTLRNVSEFVSMGLRGMGVVPVYIPASTSPAVAEQFQLSVVRQP